MGGAVAEAGGTAMNDDDLLFGDAALEDRKNSGRPMAWLEHRRGVMLARCRAQKASLEKLLASAPPAMVARFDKPF